MNVDLKKKIIPVILGFMYAVCLVFGHSLEKEGSIAYRDGRLWLTILILGILLSAALTVIMKQLQKRLLPKGLEHETGQQIRQVPAGRMTFLYAGIITYF